MRGSPIRLARVQGKFSPPAPSHTMGNCTHLAHLNTQFFPPAAPLRSTIFLALTPLSIMQFVFPSALIH